MGLRGFTSNKATASKRRGCVVMKVPFPGYYDSLYSHALDHEQQQEAENRAESDKTTQPEGLQLDDETYSELLFDSANWRKMENEVNIAYVEALDNLLTECVGFKTRLTFESMSSPKEYNFTTDRIFVDVPKATVRKLFAISRKNEHEALRAQIKRRFTSRDGFSSFYGTDLGGWLTQPVLEWDHNELETLLLAVLDLTFKNSDTSQGGNDFEWAMYYATDDGETVFNAFQAGIDWDKFDKACADKRAEMENELRAQGVEIPEPRCGWTADLFSSPPTGSKTAIKGR